MKNKKSEYTQPVVFLEEIWIHSKCRRGKSWQDDNVKNVRNPGRYDGKQFIIIHAG